MPAGFTKSWEFWLAWKYAFSKRKKGFTTLISIIAVVGVALSVASLIVVNGVMQGFQEIVTDKILSLNPHISITFYQPQDFFVIDKLIKKIIPKSEIRSIYESAEVQGLIVGGGVNTGVMLKGMPLKALFSERYIKFEQVDKKALLNSKSEVIPVIMGKKLADRLGILPGDMLRFISAQGIVTPFGFFPKVSVLKVVGFFSTGIYDYDTGLLYAPFQRVKRLLHPEFYTLEIKLKDPFKAHFYKEEIQSRLKGLCGILDWQEWNRNFFAALKLERFGLFVVLTLMIVVSLFTIIAAMVMLVSEKEKDIAILRAFGASRGSVLRMFFYSGLLLSGLGVFIGVLIGTGLCEFLSRYPVVKLPGGVYPVEYMPVSLHPGDVFLIAFIAVIISVFACLYPAKKAAETVPVQVLRNG